MIQITTYDLNEARVCLDALAAYREANPPGVPVPTGELAAVVATASAEVAAAAAPAKRTRKPKVTTEAAPAPTPPPASTEPAAPAVTPTASLAAAFDEPPAKPKPSFLDDDEEPVAAEAPVATKDDARAALVALQLKRLGQYIAKGQSESDAAKSAEAATKKVLVDATGSERLGGVPDSAFGLIVQAANKAAAQGV